MKKINERGMTVLASDDDRGVGGAEKKNKKYTKICYKSNSFRYFEIPGLAGAGMSVVPRGNVNDADA